MNSFILQMRKLKVLEVDTQQDPRLNVVLRHQACLIFFLSTAVIQIQNSIVMIITLHLKTNRCECDVP